MSSKINKHVDSLTELKTYHVGVMESSAHRALRKHKDTCLKDYGITAMQWYIIGTIADSGPDGVRITDLSKTLDTTLAFLTTTVNLLVSKNILVRKTNSEDSRSSFVALKDEYVITYQEIELTLRVKLRKSIYSHISQADLKTYVNVLSKFSKL